MIKKACLRCCSIKGWSTILFLLLSLTMSAEGKKKLFTLEDLNFGGTHYNEMSPGKRYYVWHGDELFRKDICDVQRVTYEGKEIQLFTDEDVAEALGTADALVGVNFLNVEFPYKDQPLALILTPTKRLLYDYEAKSCVFSQERTGSLEWCPEGKTDAFSRDEELWLRLVDGTERRLTNDGSRDIVYGRSVHRNEFGIEKGTFFSPDGRFLAFYRMDQSMVTDYPQVNTFGEIASYEPDKYPMAGKNSHKVTIGVHDILSDNTVWLDLGDVTDRYFTNISWSPDSKSIYLIELNRGQDHATLDQYDAMTGKKIRTILSEDDKRYVEPLHPIVFLPWDNGKFIYWSQKDGYWHLFLYDAVTGKCTRQLTKGEYVVTGLLGFNIKDCSIIIRANKEHPLQRNIYAVKIDTGVMTLLDNGLGSHSAVLSGSGEMMLDKWTSPDVSGTWTLNATEKNDVKQLYVSRNPWEGYAVPEYVQGTLKAADGKTDLYYRMVLPHDFDSTKEYPTVVYVYGGPHAHNVEATWHWNSRSWETYMAQKGYVVFVLDNRGSEDRGKVFEQVTFRQLGQIEMQDQMQGVAYLKSLPYIDKERIGVHGWSYGGFMTISLMTNYPETFKVGVAGGPVIDWKKYEVMYTERYMDAPEENPEGYDKICLEQKAADLKGRLLLIIGMNDPVVVPQHTMQFINACNEAGTYPDFYVYPGEGHNMQGHMSVHLHEKITRYFEDFLK